MRLVARMADFTKGSLFDLEKTALLAPYRPTFPTISPYPLLLPEIGSHRFLPCEF